MTPIDWAAVGAVLTGAATASVRWIIPGLKALQQPHTPSGNGTKALEARLAGGDAATLLSEVRENRRSVDEVHGRLDDLRDLTTGLAHTAKRSGELLEQLTELAVKGDDRWQAVSESTEAMSRMLQLHTGLLDRSMLQLDALHAHLPKKRGKR